MVVINHCTPHQLNAYPTGPLAENVVASVEQDFAIGSFARFGNPLTTISIQDRPDFYDASHYSIREKLDLGGFLGDFVIIDDRTADSHAIWYVTTTEDSNVKTASAIKYDNPPVTFKEEDFTLWQGRFVTHDLPVQWACFFSAVRGLEDDIRRYNHPYDPHNPQDEPFTSGLNFSKKEDARMFIPTAYFEAAFEEIDWSTDIELRKLWSPRPSVVVRLREEVAREAGLVREWTPAHRIPRKGDTISMSASYDWDSPKWSQDDTSVVKRMRSLSLMSPGNNSMRTCQSRVLLGPTLDGFRDLSNSSDVKCTFTQIRDEYI